MTICPPYRMWKTRKWYDPRRYVRQKPTVLGWVFLLIVILLLLFVSQLLGAPNRGSATEAWNGGAALAAHRLGCEHLVRQHPGEPLDAAIGLYDRRYVKGDCLLLWPESGGQEFFLGFGGDSESGNPIYYLSDTPRIRIWNGKEERDHDARIR